jgi:putative spermidine/putrescine transport system ATP-binding protein
MEQRLNIQADKDPIVEFIDVEKTYDGAVNVVDRLTLTVYRGEFLTLLGPSGSGKTTTLMMLAGFEAPTGGDITLNGASLANVPPFRRNMGIVFQNYALFPHKTVAGNVSFPLVQRKLPRSEISARVEQALRMVELEHLGDRRPAQLSGGQQQRVALARALVFEPELVLMDEPLGALDKKLREQMQLEIKHLHDTLGMTAVYVTHDQSEALTMSDRVAIFDAGVIQQIGSPRDVYEYPMNSFVANFIGENNNLHGVIAATDGEHCTVVLETGETITAKPVGADGAGARTTVSVRPERVLLRPGDGGATNRIRVKVIEVIYSGDHLVVRTQRPNGEFFVANAPPAAEYESLAPGDDLEVGWEPVFSRALDPHP